MQASQPPTHPARVTPLCFGLVAGIVASLGWPLPAAEAQTVATRDAEPRTVYYGDQRYPSDHHFYGRASEEEARELIERELVEFEASEAVRQARREALGLPERPLAHGESRYRARARRAPSARVWTSGSYAYRTVRQGYEVVSQTADGCGPYGCSKGLAYRPSYGLYSLYAPYICGAEGGYGFDGKGFNYGYGFGESTTFHDRAYWCVYRGGARNQGYRGSQSVQTHDHHHEQSAPIAQESVSVGGHLRRSEEQADDGKRPEERRPEKERPDPRLRAGAPQGR